MDKGYLLDANTIIDFSANRLSVENHRHIAGIIDEFPQISIINKIELLGFANVPKQVITFTFTENAFVIALNDEIADKTILLRKEYKIKLPDVIIAATAMVFNLTLITNNTDDFKNISDLEILNPHSLA